MEYRIKDPDDNFDKDFQRKLTCRICKLKGREETPMHLAFECLGAWEARLFYLGSYSFENEDTISWDPQSMLQFFKHFDLENKPNTL